MLSKRKGSTESFQLSKELDLENGQELGLLRSPAGAWMLPSNLSAMLKMPESKLAWPVGFDRSGLWPHQPEAIKFAHMRRQQGHRGALLAMDMGTGKLLTSLLIAATMKARIVLVVATKRAVDEWLLQSEEWWRWGPVAVLCTPKKTVESETGYVRRGIANSWQDGGTIFVLTNYQRVWREPFRAFAKGVKWDLLVMDEVHKAKSPGGKASFMLHQISKRVPFSIGLTGTPFPHSPIDIYGIARCIDDRVYGTNYQNFLNRYAVMGGYEGRQVIGYKNLDDLTQKFWGFTYRVDESVQSLPKVRNTEVKVVLDDKTMKLYKKLKKEYTVTLGERTATTDNTLVHALRLQQIASGFLPMDDGSVVKVGNDKQEALEDVLDRIEPGKTVVVFATFHHDLDSIRDIADRMGRRYGEISGRQSDYLAWRREEKPLDIIGVQYQAGSEAINLTASRIGIFYNLPLSLDLFKQARKRLHRPGQKKSVLFIFISAVGTYDVKNRRALLRRENVLQAIQMDAKRDLMAQNGQTSLSKQKRVNRTALQQ